MYPIVGVSQILFSSLFQVGEQRISGPSWSSQPVIYVTRSRRYDVDDKVSPNAASLPGGAAFRSQRFDRYECKTSRVPTSALPSLLSCVKPDLDQANERERTQVSNLPQCEDERCRFYRYRSKLFIRARSRTRFERHSTRVIACALRPRFCDIVSR